MRRSVIVMLLALTSLTSAPLPMAGADDPGPTVILGEAPFAGPDAMIRAGGSSAYVGADTRQQGRIEQSITQSQRAVSSVRICAHASRGRMRVDGTGGGRSFRVQYRVGGRDVTRRVVAGSYHTRRLRSGACAATILVVVRLKHGATSHGRTQRIRATSPSGARDSVATHVTVVGPLVVP
jgi:hypothetical protein